MNCYNQPTPCQKTNTYCIIRDKGMPINSELEGCEIRLDSIIDELYRYIGELKEQIVELQKDKKEVKTQSGVKEACDLNIEECFKVVDLDPCENPIITLGQALNYINNKIV